MKSFSINRGFAAGNPLANIVVIIVGALAIGVSVVLGFFAFVLLGSIVLVMAAMVGLRVWWINRQLGKQVPQDGRDQHRSGVIEGEYRVVADERADG